VTWKIVYTKDAQKDAKKIVTCGLKEKVLPLLEILQQNPWQNPPRYEKLLGDLQDAYSLRINIQHRLIYQIYPEQKTIKIIRMWTHYSE